jgi:AAA+ ATPase superfamily predicted ATPase
MIINNNYYRNNHYANSITGRKNLTNGTARIRETSFLVITGKVRVGKTELIKQFTGNRKALYLFVDSNKSTDI